MHDVFYRKEISMTDMTKAKVYAASLGSVFSEGVCSSLSAPGLSGFDSSEYVIFPGFCDVHVHFREPGFSYKETIATGSRAAARGGYTAVCTMPNLNPVPDSVENLGIQPAFTSTPTVPSQSANRAKRFPTWRAWRPTW